MTLSRLSARFLDALAGLADAAGLRPRRGRGPGARARERAPPRGDDGGAALAFLSALVLEALATLGTAVVAVEVGLRLLYARIAFREALFVLAARPGVLPAAARARGRVPRRDGRAGGRRAHGAIVETEGPLAAPAVGRRRRRGRGRQRGVARAAAGRRPRA